MCKVFNFGRTFASGVYHLDLQAEARHPNRRLLNSNNLIGYLGRCSANVCSPSFDMEIPAENVISNFPSTILSKTVFNQSSLSLHKTQIVGKFHRLETVNTNIIHVRPAAMSQQRQGKQKACYLSIRKHKCWRARCWKLDKCSSRNHLFEAP